MGRTVAAASSLDHTILLPPPSLSWGSSSGTSSPAELMGSALLEAKWNGVFGASCTPWGQPVSS